MKCNYKLAVCSVLVGWSLTTIGAFANLGDTYSASVERYGAQVPQFSNTVRHTFNYAGWVVTEFFNPAGYCDVITYAHRVDANGKPVDLTDTEIHNLLSINSPRGNWWEEGSAPAGRHWNIRGNNSAVLRFTAELCIANYTFGSAGASVDCQQLTIASERGLKRLGLLLPPRPTEKDWQQPTDNATDMTKI